LVFEEKREFERRPLELEAKCEINRTIYDCIIKDISLKGMGIKMGESVLPREMVKITIGNQNITGIVVRTAGDTLGINFNLLTQEQLDSISDFKLISDAADRALALNPLVSVSKEELVGDLSNCHDNVCRLDLNKLMGFGDFDFINEISGILMNLNRMTGKLENFTPKSAKVRG
jgi:hypothetical protein